MFGFSKILSLLTLFFLCAPAMSQQSYIFDDELDVALSSPDWQVLKNLRNEGDLRKRKRPVDHFVYPRGLWGAKQAEFISAIKKHEGVAEVEKLQKKGIRVEYNSDTRAQSIARMIDFLSKTAPQYGYIYDGWGTHIIKK
jgi:hypothetical protein